MDTGPGSTRQDIFVYDLRRQSLTKITFAGERNAVPVWTPDGKHITYLSRADGKFALMWMRADGVGEPQRLWESKNIKAPTSFSPDGRWLAFWETSPETNGDLWTLRLDLSDPDHPKAGHPQVLLRTPAREVIPAISPDGRWFAYESIESGRPEIYVRPFAPGSPGAPTGSGGKWAISTGRYPTWSRVGRQLFFETQDDHLMVADYTVEGDSFRPEKPRLWVDKQFEFLPGISPSFDTSGDGKRMVWFPAAERPVAPSGNVHLTVLLNWFDEVRRRLSPGGK